jgi:hypothetical protein
LFYAALAASFGAAVFGCLNFFRAHFWILPYWAFGAWLALVLLAVIGFGRRGLWLLLSAPLALVPVAIVLLETLYVISCAPTKSCL